MKEDLLSCEIRAAQCIIRDREEFLEGLQSIGRKFNSRIICFNADAMAGRRHAESAVRFARRSWERGCAIANTFEMEALLYAAGSRQCNVASEFGIHVGKNHLYICCDPHENGGVWIALSSLLEYQDIEKFEFVDQKKTERLINLFHISPRELESMDTGTTITDLVLERVALLQVLR